MYVAATGMGALNCPGDPGCPGYVEPGGVAWQNSMLEAILANQVAGNDAATIDEGMTPTAKVGLGISGTTVALAGAALFGVVLLMKAGR